MVSKPGQPAQPNRPARGKRGKRERRPGRPVLDYAGQRDRRAAKRRAAGELPDWLAPAGLSAALILLVIAAFAPALSAGFFNLDDDDYVYANPYVRQGLTWPGIVWAWTTHPLGYQIPLTWMSLMVDASPSNADPSGIDPGPFHRTNVLLHAGGAVLLMLALRRATGSTWRAALAAGLWAVHPLRVESVAWVTERKDVLAGFFGFGALYAYTWYASNPGREPGSAGPGVRGKQATSRHVAYALTIGLYCLSLLSKPQVIMALPVVLWLLDYWPLRRMRGSPEDGAQPIPSTTPGPADPDHPRRSAWSLALEKWPLVLATLVAAAATAYGEYKEGAVRGDIPIDNGARVANAFLSPPHYLEKLFDFRYLAPIYPFSNRWNPAAVAAAAVFLLAVTAAVLWQRRRRPWLAVGWFWFLIALAPGLTPPPGLMAVSMADRFAYFPAVGLSLMAVWSIPDDWAADSRGQPWLATGAIGCLLVLGVFSFFQSRLWGDREKLWRHTLEVTKDNWLAQNNLANTLEERGELMEALAHQRECQRINPNYFRGWMNEALLLNRTGAPAAALACADRALALEPNSFQAHLDRIDALAILGRNEDVVPACEAALRLEPNSAHVHEVLAMALFRLGRREESFAHFRRALELDPNNTGTRINYEWALRQPPPTAPATAPTTGPSSGPTTAPTPGAGGTGSP